MLSLITLLVVMAVSTADQETGNRKQETGDRKQETALKFGADTRSYIWMTPNMTALEYSYTVCSWVKRMRDGYGIDQVWLSYIGRKDYEIAISDVGRYYAFKRLVVNRPDTAPRTVGQWHHFCATRNGTRAILYYDGTPLGSKYLGDYHRLTYNGSLVLGKLVTNWGPTNLTYFGGELYDLNIYKYLSPSTVKEMFIQGRCSNFSQTFRPDQIVISWDSILRHRRHGNISEVYLDCPRNDTESLWDFLYGDQFYMRIISDDLIGNLTIFGLLEEFEGHRIDDNLIEHLKKHHEIEIMKNAWDVLYDTRYYNKIITKDLVEHTAARWSMLREFKGHRIDDNLIMHLKRHHDNKNSRI